MDQDVRVPKTDEVPVDAATGEMIVRRRKSTFREYAEAIGIAILLALVRSEERRVGKECRL